MRVEKILDIIFFEFLKNFLTKYGAPMHFAPACPDKTEI